MATDRDWRVGASRCHTQQGGAGLPLNHYSVIRSMLVVLSALYRFVGEGSVSTQRLPTQALYELDVLIGLIPID